MKKLVLLLVLFTGIANAQIVSIPDAAFKAKLLALGLDTNADGNIQNNEALNVDTIDVSNSNITDLTGILSFTNLFHLVCSNNSISDLNLTGLSNLQIVDCSNNQMLTLNLTGVLNLHVLTCSNNQLTALNGISNTISLLTCDHNRLTSFNATSLNNLLYLDLSYNRITTIDFSGVPNLGTLLCNSNLLTSVDINNLSNLNTFDCSYNKLTELTVSNLPALVALYCKVNTELTTVTLSNLSSLQNLDFTGVTDTGGGNYETGNLTNLTLSNLPQLTILSCSHNKIATLNLTNLTNLVTLDCTYNQLSSLSLLNLPNLTTLSCYINKLQTLDVTHLNALVTLRCGGGYRVNNQLTNVLSSINVAGLSNLNWFECFDTLITTIDLAGLTNLEHFYFAGIDNAGVLSSLNVNGLTNLNYLDCHSTALTTLDVSNLVNLEELGCWQSHLTDLNLNGLTHLKKLNYSFNYLTSLSLTNLPLLENLSCGYNQLTTLNVSDLTNLKSLGCNNNYLTTLNLNGLTSLTSLDFSNNNISLPTITGLSPDLVYLGCGFNNLTSLDVSGFPALKILSCRNNQLTSLNLSFSNNLTYLDCQFNQLSTLNLSNLNNLEHLECNYNSLTTVSTSNLTQLTVLQCTNNQISALDLTNNPLLEILSYSNNPLPNLDLNNLVNLKGLSCFDTQTSDLNISNLAKLQYLYADNNLLQTLDASNCQQLNYLSCTNNQLSTLFIKNGKNEGTIDISNNPNLQYICADADQLYNLQTQLNQLGMSATVSNSYCTFSPGGNHNTISGITIFDKDNNGCDVTDEVNPFIRLDITDGVEMGATVTNINGSYSYYTNAGNYTITPNVENPTWFSFSPSAANFTFADNNNNLSNQDFCIQALGVHNDIEVVLIPIDFARPGFNSTYKIVYKNKGNQMHTGAVSLSFDDSRIDLVTAAPTVNVANLNTLTWNFTNLMPFENRSIDVTLHVNSPTETPAVHIGDILNFSTNITPLTGDELPNDNSFVFNQIVVGSFDPNAITCLEGATVSTSEIGNYLHYAINFENLGTFYAENVVVRVEIDPTKYDISTLQVMNTSHPSTTRITGNTVEFIMQDINLAAAGGTPPVGGHGDVLFKIRTKNNLLVNDTVLQNAGIYFDYNAPVVTNDALTTFNTLANTVHQWDDSINIYPNPTENFITISCQSAIKTIELFDIQGRLLETELEENGTAVFDLAAKQNGVYFLKITTEAGSKVEKVVKK